MRGHCGSHHGAGAGSVLFGIFFFWLFMRGLGGMFWILRVLWPLLLGWMIVRAVSWVIRALPGDPVREEPPVRPAQPSSARRGREAAAPPVREEAEKKETVREERGPAEESTGEEMEYKKAKESLPRLRFLADRMADAQIRLQMKGILQVLEKIFERVDSVPALLARTEVKKCVRTYLPILYRLTVRYAEIQGRGLAGKEFEELEDQMRASLPQIESALSRLLESLYREDVMDVSTDLTVLGELLTRDGYAARD